MNKRHYIYLLACSLWLVLSSAVQGQNIFQKRSDLNISYVRYNSVFPSDTGFFVTGWDLPLIPIDSNSVQVGNYELLYSWYNWTGELLDYKTFGESNKNFSANWFDTDPISNNAFFSFGTLSDTGNIQDIMAIKFKRNGDTVWTKRYNSGNEDYGYSCISDSNGGMIGVGTSKVGSSFCSRVIRYDSLGGIIWNKIFNCAVSNFAAYIVKDDENYYIGGSRKTANVSGNIRTMVFKIDSAGTLIWTKYLPATCSETAGVLALANDGNVLVANDDCVNEISFTTYTRFGLTKLNKNTGDTLWSKVYPTQYQNSTNAPLFIENLNDGNILIGGAGYKLFVENEDTLFGRQAGVLIKTDSMGNLKWQKYYLYNEEHADSMYENYITSGKQAPDGGLILVGKTKHYVDFDDGWIIKTDANGCIDAGCVNGVEELEEDDYRLFIYPNPAQDYVSIDLPITYTKATLQIINMQGQVVKIIAINSSGLQHIDVSSLPKGIYNFAVQSNNNLIGRQKVVVY